MKAFKEFVAEKKDEGDAYEQYFEKMLKKWKIDSPDELSDEESKKFFDAVDAGWESDKEEKGKDD